MFKKKNPCVSCSKEEELDYCRERIAQLEAHISLLSGLLENHSIEIPKSVKDDAELKIYGSEEYIYNELYLIRQSMNLSCRISDAMLLRVLNFLENAED